MEIIIMEDNVISKPEKQVKTRVHRFTSRATAKRFADNKGLKVESCPLQGTNIDGFFKYQCVETVEK